MQKPLHSLNCTDWVAISKHGIIGAFWFEDDNEHCVIINTDRYVQVILKFWIALSRLKNIIRVRQWFQQDDCIPHTSKESLVWLNKRFSDRFISRKCDPQWLPYSRDLNWQVFYLWGYINGKVYAHKPQSIPDLKTEIKATIKAIPREECEKVIKNFSRRIQVC